MLTNGNGGISGKGVLPIGLKCVREIAAVTGVPYIVSAADTAAADDGDVGDGGNFPHELQANGQDALAGHAFRAGHPGGEPARL